ncbi:GNAT family N-acetyltransferase [Ammoniphilus sp. CFH 90114]|uniref:GNAT family N-acetyltransferase n=1 Tax=Ammoniphilus sp. CFH 90114 TaxID=2493665 RepID=UPI00100E6486|nr:GNAT family N-acetyltransferase [Ammoniphilus sp. CFH 90114]RXT03612.1 N-acetyltransferase [Ammoniphilus sp. CFH 90114]
MQIGMIEAFQLPLIRQNLLDFIQRFGDKRITHKAIRWLDVLSVDELKQRGNGIAIAIERGELIGVLVVAQFGIHHSFIAVHNDHRKRGIAKLLLREVTKRMDRFYARIAMDNIPSLSTSFSIGMVAIEVVKGPTGKPTLLLGWGNWDRENFPNKM